MPFSNTTLLSSCAFAPSDLTRGKIVRAWLKRCCAFSRYTILNDLAIASRVVQADGSADKVRALADLLTVAEFHLRPAEKLPQIRSQSPSTIVAAIARGTSVIQEKERLCGRGGPFFHKGTPNA